MAVVNPKEERHNSKTRPGVIMKTARMTKTGVEPAKGETIAFFKQAESEDNVS